MADDIEDPLAGADDAVAAVLHEDNQNTAIQIRNNLQFSADANPDQEANYQHLAKFVGVPVDTVRAQPQAIKTQAALQQFDANNLAAQAPQTAQLLTNLDNTRMLHDDIGGTAAVEQAVTSMSQWQPSLGQRIRGWINDAFGLTERERTRAGIQYAAQQSGMTPAQASEAVGGMSEIPMQAASKFVNTASFGLIPDMAGTANTTAGAIAGGAGQLAGFLTGPMAATDALAGKIGLGALEHVAGESFAKGLAKDVATQSLKLGTASALADVGNSIGSPDLTTALQQEGHDVLSGAGTGAIFGAAGRLLPDTNLLSTVARIAGVQSAMDLAQGKTPYQDIANWDQLSPAERGDAAFNLLLNGAFSLHGAGRAEGGWFQDAAKADLGVQDAQKLAALSQVSTAAKFRDRDPAAFHQFIDNMTEDGNLSNVYIDGKTLVDAFNQSGVTGADLDQKMPAVAAQINEALQTNGDVAIPVADYATHIAGGPADAAILPNLKTSPDGSTYAEAQQFYQTQTEQLKEQANDIIAQKAQDDVFQANQQQVYDNVLGQLNTANRFTPDVNKAYASLVRDFYVTTADKMGVMPTDLMAQYPLNVAVERMAGDGFDQPAYHGSPHNFDSFSSDAIGTGEGAQAFGHGLYFAENPEVAAGYFRNLADNPAVKEMKLGSLRVGEHNAFDYSRRAHENTRENIRASLAEDLLVDSNKLYTVGTGGFREHALKTLDEKIAGYKTEGYDEVAKAGGELRKMLEAPGALSISFHPVKGGVYQVDIPDEHVANFLDWDKPLSEQSEGVKDALEIARKKAEGLETDGGISIKSVPDDTLVGEGLYGALSRGLGSDKAASDYLDSLGVKGIKYLDAGSRGNGEGTRNLVVFDDKLIKLTHKDGMPVTAPEREEYLQEAGGGLESPGNSVYNQSGKKRDDYTQDLFGLPESNGADKSAGGSAAGRSIRLVSRGDAPGTYATRTKLVKENTRELGADKIDSPASAAQALAGLGKHAVERFDALITDKDGKPLAVVGAFKGALAQTSVYPSTVVAEAFRVKGAANIWFAHNHPSGLDEFSGADRNLHINLREAFRGSDITPHGLFAIAGKKGEGRKWVYTGGPGTSDLKGATVAPSESVRVPVVERIYSKEEALGPAISSPGDARVAVKKIADGEPGVILLSNQNVPVAFVPIEPGEAGTLRAAGRMDALYRAISMANAGSAIIVDNGSLGDIATRNLAGLFNSMDTRVLDVMDTSGSKIESLAEKGFDFSSRSFSQGNRGAYNPETNTIALLKNADLSTFLHETGHHFLEMMSDLAVQPNAPAGIQQDFGQLLNWFGVRDAAEWNNLSFEEKRAYHEQFARGFEAYLMEGKAPNVELTSLFQRFRSWLLNVYKSLSGLKVELTPEVRGVMDRMLASDESIKQAEQVRGYSPLFKSAADAGMTPEQYADYQQLGSAATEDAIDEMQARSIRDMKWLTGAKDRAIRALQKEAAGKRREMRGEVSGEVMSQPVYQAWQFLKARENLDDSKPAPAEKRPEGVDSERDSLFKAIAKLGGINKDALTSEWGLDPADKPDAGIVGKPVLRAEGKGRSLDGMAQTLAEHGYLTPDEHGKVDLREFEDKFFNELHGSPEYSSNADYDYLRRGETPQGDLTLRNGGRLDTDAVRRLPGGEKVEALRMTKKGGIDPDLAAEMFGFGSGQEMVRTLADAQHPREVIEGLTDQRMLERYGDLSDPQAIERAAEAAIHNEARARFVATELKALAKAQGPARMIAQAATEAADTAIAAKRVRDVRPTQYAVAEAKAAKNADKALLGRDIVAAANEKRAQLLNNRLAKAAQVALEDVRKGVDYLKKFDKASVRASIELDYREQIDALLDQYDLRTSTSGKALDRRQSLRDWYADQIERGYNPAIPDALMDNMAATHYKDMTIEQFRGLVDAVKSIEHLGRLKQRLQDGQEMREFTAVVADAQDAMGKLPQRKPETNRGLSRVQEKWLGAKSMVRSLDASLLKMEQVFDWLDDHSSNGVFNRVVFRRIADAGVKEADLRKDVSDKLHALADAMPHQDLRAIVPAPELIDSRTGEPSNFTKGQILAMALNTGNESNMAKMLAGERWTEQGVWQVLHRSMTGDDWHFVQGVWDVVEGLWPEIEAMERRLGNSAPDKVVPRPISTPYGETRGGYYPVVYDPLRSFDVEQNRQRGGDKMFENNYQRATTPKGHTIARTENYARPILLSMDVLPRHLGQVIHDIAYREAIIDADRFLADKRIREGIETTLGREYYQQLRPWLQAIANDKTYDAKGLAFWDKAAHWARTSATLVGLGYRATTMLIHGATAASNSVGELGAKWFASGIRDTLGSPDKMVAAKDFIFERSGEMRNRMNEVDRDVRDALREMELRSAGGVEKIADPVRRFAYYGISMLDMASALPTWMGAYNKAMTGGLGEQDAIYAADKAVRNAHGGGGAKDNAAAQRGPEFQKLFTTFYSFWNHFYNRQRDMARTAGAIPDKVRQGDYAGARRDFAMVLARSWFYFIIPQLLHAALKPPAPNQDKEQGWVAWAAEEIGLGAFSGIPVLRDIANSAVTGRDYQATPAVSIIQNAGRTGLDIEHAVKGEPVSDKWLKHAITTSGYVFGLPTGQPASTAQFLWDVGDGTQNPQDVADWYHGLMHGDMRAH